MQAARDAWELHRAGAVLDIDRSMTDDERKQNKFPRPSVPSRRSLLLSLPSLLLSLPSLLLSRAQSG